MIRAPVIGICGYSGAGKTALIETVVPRLRRRGLRIAVVKHDAHGLRVDHPGTDSDRVFGAGADVLVHGPDEALLRTHAGNDDPLARALEALSPDHDLVLVEGHKDTPLPKLWLLRDDEGVPPDKVENILEVLPRGTDRAARLMGLLERWLTAGWRARPVYGCILIGGASRRMGRPKHLMEQDGETWVERAVARLDRRVERVVLAGAGAVPAALAHCPGLPDVPGVDGPLAGMLAAMRWAPEVSWLVTACDMPDLSDAALHWLLETRAPGVWATVPMVAGRPEPLLAHYDPRGARLLERLAAAGVRAPRAVVAHAKVAAPEPPPGIIGAWRNINTVAGLD